MRLLLLVALVLAPTLAGAQTAVPDPARGTNGMVVSAHADASDAGREVLMAGGNAVDAAVATGFALAVTYPVAGNVGGGGFMVIREPDGSATTYDYRERAPAGATRDMFLDSTGAFVPQPLAAGIPRLGRARRRRRNAQGSPGSRPVVPRRRSRPGHPTSPRRLRPHPAPRRPLQRLPRARSSNSRRPSATSCPPTRRSGGYPTRSSASPTLPTCSSASPTRDRTASTEAKPRA